MDFSRLTYNQIKLLELTLKLAQTLYETSNNDDLLKKLEKEFSCEKNSEKKILQDALKAARFDGVGDSNFLRPPFF